MIISLGVKKHLTKYQHPFMLKVLERSRIQGGYINIIKAIPRKRTANIKLNGEILEAIPLKSETRMTTLPYLFNIALKVLARTIRQQKEIKGIQIGKEEIKVSLSADDMIVYIRDPQNSTREYLQLIHNLSKVSDIKLTQINQ